MKMWIRKTGLGNKSTTTWEEEIEFAVIAV